MFLKSILMSSILLVTSVSSYATENFETKISADLYEKFEKVSASTLSMLKADTNQVRVIIKLQEQNKTSMLFGNSKINELIQKNLAKQQQFLESLQQSGLYNTSFAKGFTPAIQLRLQNAIAGYIPSIEVAEQIAQFSDVESIEVDTLNKLFTVEGRALTGSDVAAASGYTGKDVGIAIIDSHFDLLHEELGGSTELPNGVVFAGENFSDPGEPIFSQELNDCYHGTGTASIARRYAPDSGLYALTVFPNAYNSTIANAINWVIENKDGVAGGPPIKIISMSLGGEKYYYACNTGVIHEAAATALENGIVVFAASGNDGYTNAMASPACSDNVISIGSVWDEDDANYEPFSPAYCDDDERLVNERTCYSNKAPMLDLYAPSEEVECALCGGGTWTLGGTSSATPAAAGMTAQLLQAKPELALDKDLLVSNYQETGITVIGDEDKRRIDLLAAIGDIVTNPPEIDSVSTTANEKFELVAITASDVDSDLDSIVLYVDENEYSTIDIDTSETSVTVTEQIKYVTLEAGQHCVKAYAVDRASNNSEWSEEVCFISPEVPRNPPVIESLSVEANGLAFTVTGAANDPDSDLDHIEIAINNSEDWITVDGSYEFSYSSSEMEEGTYTIRARAIDEGGLVSEVVEADSIELVFICQQYTNTNSEHEAAGRAYSEISGWWWYGTTTWYTSGSDEELGTSSSEITTIKEMPKGYYSIGTCSNPDPVAPVITEHSYTELNGTLTIFGSATDANNDISSITAQIEGGDQITCEGTYDFTCTYDNLEPGTYNVTLQASDETDLVGIATFDATITDNQSGECITKTNYDHVQQGRAYTETVWYVSNAYANGSDDHLGYTGSMWYSTVTSLKEQSSGYWVKVDSCD